MSAPATSVGAGQDVARCRSVCPFACDCIQRGATGCPCIKASLTDMTRATYAFRRLGLTHAVIGYLPVDESC